MKRRPERFEAFLANIEGQPKWQLVIWGVLLTVFLGVIDFLSGDEISISFFYLLPVALLGWAVSAKAAIALALLAVVVRLGGDFLAGQRFSQPWIWLWNGGVNFGAFAVAGYLFDHLHAALHLAQTLARTDDLTGGMNHRAFRNFLSLELERARRYHHPFTVAYIDLDHFKNLNDRLGHSAGDAALKTIGEIFLGYTRRTDVFARLGGDEFILYLAETGRKEAQQILPRLSSILQKEIQARNWDLTFSIGALTFLSYPESVDEVIGAADRLMYEVKRGGKNGILYSTYEK